ncbi:hypothetical protein ACHAW6_001625 [Cyclotella cf. meneghiniana]
MATEREPEQPMPQMPPPTSRPQPTAQSPSGMKPEGPSWHTVSGIAGEEPSLTSASATRTPSPMARPPPPKSSSDTPRRKMINTKWHALNADKTSPRLSTPWMGWPPRTRALLSGKLNGCLPRNGSAHTRTWLTSSKRG